MKHRCTLPILYTQRKAATQKCFCFLQNNPLCFDSFPSKRKKSPTRLLRWKCRCTKDIQTALKTQKQEESPEPLRVLGVACYANAQLAQGYSFQDAKRLVLEREEEALAYAARQFRAA